jgi:hypothetical protein
MIFVRTSCHGLLIIGPLVTYALTRMDCGLPLRLRQELTSFPLSVCRSLYTVGRRSMEIGSRFLRINVVYKAQRVLLNQKNIN